MKLFSILIIILIAISITFGGIFFVLQYITSQPSFVEAPTKEVIKEETPKTQQPVEMENVYGIQIQKKCVAKLQDFVKSYGADYSKCLQEFNFNEKFCAGFNPDTQGLANFNVVVILDSSGSMAEKIDDVSKSDIAKKSIADFFAKMPQGVNTGLVVYGHKGSNSTADKELSCKGIEEVVRLGNNNYSSIISSMNAFSPKGWTPIAGSIDFAKNIFQKSGEGNKNYLILLSDGGESCDGDPVLSAENLKIQLTGLKFIVIGFATDDQTKNTLTDVAKFGGGEYLDASNASSIAQAFNDQLLLIKKDCLKMTLFKLFSGNNTNNLNNAKCWLDSYQKEAKDFTENFVEKTFDSSCNIDVSKAIQARQNDFWLKKQEIEEDSNTTYKKIEIDFNNQLKALDSIVF
jgi:hypothetical protein